MIYQVVKIPTTAGIVHDVVAQDIDGVRDWIKDNLPLNHRWIIKLDGKNIGEGIVCTMYRAVGDKTCHSQKFNFVPGGNAWFSNKADALADRDQHSAAAQVRLDVIVNLLDALRTNLDFCIDYTMDGDTHGIYDDHQYIGVDQGGYTFTRRID